MTQARAIKTANQENPGLLHLGNKGYTIIIFSGDRYSQHHLIEITVEMVVTGVDVQVDIWLQLLAENIRALWRLKRQILDVNALQGKLGGWLLLAGRCRLTAVFL